MVKSDSTNTTDPSAPTTEQMDEMWRALRRQEEDEAHRRSVNLLRRVAYGEAA